MGRKRLLSLRIYIYLKRGGGEKIEIEKSFIKRSSQIINVKKGYVATD